MSAEVPAPPPLAFADKKVDGAFPVTGPDGAPVAWIRVNRWSGSSFEAVTPDGTPLCSGRHRSWFSSYWDVVDGSGATIASLKAGFTGRRKTITLADGRTLVLAGQMFGRDWQITDESGAVVVGSEPSTSSWSFHPDAWLVRSYDPSISLPLVVGIVEAHRAALKASRSANNAAAVS